MAVTFDFSFKKVLVTGASQGIGRELSLALAKCGAIVVACARNEAALDSLCSEDPNSLISKLVCDVTCPDDVLRAAIEPHLPFDFLVNNAGIGILDQFGEISGDTITKVMDVNFKAPLLISQIVAKGMIDNKINGSIVNVSSQASLRPLDNHTVYCSSKAALDMATRCMANELGPHGIRVNCVNPTVVWTEMGRKAWSDETKTAIMLNKMFIKRFAEVDDVICSIMFLLSDGSAMTTGSQLPVDGGFSS